MPANNKSGLVHYWAAKYPGAIGHLWSPGGTITQYDWLPFACDNGRFAQREKWDEAEYLDFLDQVRHLKSDPLWIAVPDVVEDGPATLEEWHRWESRLRRYGWPLAIVVQDGMTPSNIPAADCIFIGGSDRWRWAWMPQFVATGIPVHMGRVNGDRLWTCFYEGCTSCDGTGWFRGDQKQLNKLRRFLAVTRGGEPIEQQLELFEKVRIRRLACEYQLPRFDEGDQPNTWEITLDWLEEELGMV